MITTVCSCSDTSGTDKTNPSKDCNHSYGEWYKENPCDTLEWKKCKYCDNKDFRTVDAGHQTNNKGVCVNCGTKIIYSQEEVKNIIQIQFFNLGEYDGGALSEIKIVFKNTSQKEIDEIFFGVTGYYNGESDVHRCTYPGNVKPGAVAGNGHYYEPLWPSSGMYGIKITSINITYTDGTKERIFDDNVKLAFWGSTVDDLNKDEEILDSGYPNLSASKGLKYTDYQNGLAVSGIGTCTDIEIVIPEKYNGKSVLAVQDFAFQGNTQITKISFPKTLRSIGKFAFDGCGLIEIITVPDAVTFIGAYAFRGCESLKEITLPFIGNTDSGLSEGTFFGYIFGAAWHDSNGSYVPSTLKKVTITKGYVASWAFNGCTSLETVILPNGLQEVGERTFKGCSSLKKIVLPDSITSIGEFAFSGCKELCNIDIPKSVTNIDYCAFYSCSKLNFTYKGTVKQWDNIAKGDSWDDLTENYVIYCTDGNISKT